MSQHRPLQVLGPNEPVHFQLITKDKKRSERKQLDPMALLEILGNPLKMNANSLVKTVLTHGERKSWQILAATQIMRMHQIPDRASQCFHLFKLSKPMTSTTMALRTIAARKETVLFIRDIALGTWHRTVKRFVESVI